jgi:hypothetical protein
VVTTQLLCVNGNLLLNRGLLVHNLFTVMLFMK